MHEGGQHNESLMQVYGQLSQASALSQDGFSPASDDLVREHRDLMDAYVTALNVTASCANDPELSKQRWGDKVDGSFVRRYTQLHLRQRLQDLRHAYAGMTAATAHGDGRRQWLLDARTDLTDLRDSLHPWRWGQVLKPAALLGLAGSVTALARNIHFSDTALLLMAVFGVVAVFIASLVGLIWLSFLFTSFRAKRSLFMDFDIYAKEDALFGRAGITKKKEQLTDFGVLIVLATFVPALAFGFALLFDLPALGSGMAIEGMWVISIFAISWRQRRAQQHRSPR
jgi:hypothetical protein